MSVTVASALYVPILCRGNVFSEGSAIATTKVHLYRAVMGKPKDFKITIGEDAPRDILDPRWEATQYYSNAKKKMMTSRPDVNYDKDGKVLPGGGTSLHDVTG